MILQYGDRLYNINVESVALNTIGFVGLFASIFDGFGPGYAALMVFIIDSIRNPYPNILDVTEEMENDGDLDDDDINPV